MRERVKGGDTRGRPVGGWVEVEEGEGCGEGSKMGMLAGAGSGRSLDIPGKHNKAAAFYIQKKRRWPLSAPPPRRHTPPPFAFFIYLFFPEQCHVLPGPAGSQRPSSALTFGTSETRSEGGRGRGKGRGSRRASGRASARVKFQPGGLVGVAGRRERNAVGKGQNKQTSKQRERASEPMHQKSGQSQESQADRPSSTTTMSNLCP